MSEQQKSGAMVLSDDLKNPAMEKLDLVRKWSINTYKVILLVFSVCFVRQPPCCERVPLIGFLCSAVYEADPVGEAGPRLEDRGPGAGGTD